MLPRAVGGRGTPPVSSTPPESTEKTSIERELDRQRWRAEAAEALAHEEGNKVEALQRLVEQLVEESASLQRKWQEAKREHPPPPKPPLVKASTSPSTRNATSTTHTAAAVAQRSPPPPLWSPPASACSGVLLLHFNSVELNGLLDEEADASPLFLEFWLDETLVRSHALPKADRRPGQSFALPIRVADNTALSTPPLALCATLCAADGEGGGRPVAIAVVHPHVPSLPAFAPSEVSVELRSQRAPDGQ